MTAPPRGHDEHCGVTAPDVQTVSKALLTTDRSKNATFSDAAQTMLKGGSLSC